MIKAVISVGAAAIIATLVTVVPALQVEAGTALRGTIVPIEEAIQAPVPHNSKPECAQRAWPYYGPECLTAAEGRQSADTRAVRVVTTDRLK